MNANARLLGSAAFLLALAACGTSPSDARPPWLAGLIEAQLAEPAGVVSGSGARVVGPVAVCTAKPSRTQYSYPPIISLT